MNRPDCVQLFTEFLSLTPGGSLYPFKAQRIMKTVSGLALLFTGFQQPVNRSLELFFLGPSCRIAVGAVFSSQSRLLMKQKCCRNSLAIET